MAAATHDIDPDGDIILKLTDANAPFAVWPEKDATDADGKEHETFTDNLDGIDASSEAGEDPEQQGDAVKPSTNSVSSSADENVNTPERPVVPAPEVHLRLSSKHLTLVSPYFKSMLCGPWKEGDRSGTQTRVLTAESWDQDALLTVMCIIHGRNKKVPREVDIEMMAKIAVIVDYYQCHEALEVFSDIWLKELKRTVLLPEAYNRDAVLWLHIANVFSDDLTVRSMTRIMQRDLTEPLSTLGLPVPASVVDRLEAFRTQSIGRLIDEIHVHFTSLSQSFPRTCTDRCDLMSLGAITREMATNNLLLRPKLPYRGKSVGQLMTIMEALRKPSWCPSTHLSRKSKYRYESDFWSDLHSTGKSEGGACQQAEKSWPALQEVMAGIVGFGL